jgi:hypothetical protein
MALPNVAEQDHHAVMEERSSAAMWGSMERDQKAGIEGRQSATPKAIAVSVGFVNERMLNLYFRSGMPKGRTIGTSEPCAVSDALRRSVMVFDSARRPIAAGYGQHHADAMPGQPRNLAKSNDATGTACPTDRAQVHRRFAELRPGRAIKKQWICQATT